MSVENDNTIRFRGTDAAFQIARQKKVFENQIPGRYVTDGNSITYVCTTSKTENGEPIWTRVNDVTHAVYGNYILVNIADSIKSAESRTASGKKYTYSIAAVSKRMNVGQLYSKAAYGNYVFISVAESTTVASSPAGTIATTSTVSTDSSDAFLVSSIFNAKKEIAEIHNFLRIDTNNRSGSGEQSAQDTPAKQMKYSIATIAAKNKDEYSSSTPASKNPSAASGSSTKRSSSGGSSSSPSRTPNSPVNPTVVVNFLPDKNLYNGYNAYSGYADKPHIQQIVTVFDSSNKSEPTRQRIIRRHMFEIVPNTFAFSQLSSTWNEVERSGNFPMVDWSKYNLTKCSFSFLIAGRRTDTIGEGVSKVDTVVNDGLDVSIDNQIENLRAIAGAPYPVIFNNFNTLLSTSFRFPYLENTRGIQWVISDLSVTATRLTPNGRGIAAAEVSITLNEYPVISRNIVPLPPLSPDRPVPKQCKPKPCKPPKPRLDGVFTADYVLSNNDTLETPEAK